ncbi:MAG: DUF4070 domain-containing protein, partial [Candidatus Shapirobacteria bacterium]
WKPCKAGRVSFRELLAVPISIFLQGIASRYRHYYWWFLLRILVLHPSKLPRAFTTAISGYHFIDYTKYVARRLVKAEQRLLREAA